MRKPFSTIRLAVESSASRRNLGIEVSLRANDTITSYNLDDFPQEDDDMADAYPLSDVKKELPRDGRILVYARSRRDDDYYNDYVLTLKDAQVVEIDGQAWQAPPEIRKKPAPEMHKEATELVHSTVKSLLTLMRRSKAIHWSGESAPRVRISFHPKRRISRGGLSGLSFGLNHWMRHGELTFSEYASYRQDPEIGAIKGPWQTIVKVIVAHELAHWAQYSGAVRRPSGPDYRKPHGDGFQDIYRFLRRKVLA